MRTKTILAAILASSVLASPALARDDSWYVEADFGGMWVPETDLDIGITPDAAKVRFQRGWEAGGVIGYDFGQFRLEAEGTYRWTRANQLTTVVNIPGSGTLVTGPFIGTTVEGNLFVTGLQDSRAWGAMANGLIDLGPDDGLQVYVGGGVGWQKVEHTLSANRLGPGWINDSDGGFAWQGLAGLRYPISDHIDIGLKYRFLNVRNVERYAGRGQRQPIRKRPVGLVAGGARNPVVTRQPHVVEQHPTEGHAFARHRITHRTGHRLRQVSGDGGRVGHRPGRRRLVGKVGVGTAARQQRSGQCHDGLFANRSTQAQEQHRCLLS